MDAGQREADAALHKLELRIKRVYSEAARDMKAKVEKYYKDFARKDAAKQALVKEGRMSQQAYEQWRVGQLMIGKRWEEQLDVLTADLNNADKLARSMVEGHRPEAYAIGHNYSTYEAETLSGMDTSYTLYDAQTVERLIRDNPDLLPPYAEGSDTDKLIRANRQARWNKSRINGAVLQGVLQGEAIDKIAKRLLLVTGMGARKAVLMARTAACNAQNAGREDGLQRAKDMGVNLKQAWNAVKDNRTRHSHRQLDGEVKEVGEKFSNGCVFPGDFNCGDPSEVYNCRCQLIAVVYSPDGAKRYGNRPLEVVEYPMSGGRIMNVSHLDPHAPGGLDRVTRSKTGMSYDEWKDAKPKSESKNANGSLQSRRKRDKMKVLDEAVPVPYEDQKIVNGLWRIPGEHGRLDDIKATNPKYGTFEWGYQNNCQRCVIAYEARRRGFDVRAREAYEIGDNFMRGTYWTDAFQRGERRLDRLWHVSGLNIGESKGFTTQQCKDAIQKAMDGYGNGSRAFIRGDWDHSNSGHVFIAENIKGKVHYFDPQNGSMNCEEYFNRMPPRFIEILRVDDLPFSADVWKAVENND